MFEPRQPRPSAIETLAQGTPKDSMGYTFEFVRERQFSGLQVVSNPAVPVIWIASAMMLAGMLVVFNFPLRRVWARLDPLDEGGVRLRMAAVSNRDVLFAREFEKVSLEIDRRVRALPPDRPVTGRREDGEAEEAADGPAAAAAPQAFAAVEA